MANAEHAGLDGTPLIACFTNGQPDARHELRAGDSLKLGFTAGDLAGCALAPDASGFGDHGDWECVIVGRVATLTYVGPARPWLPTETACVSIEWVAPDRPTTVVFTSDPEIGGSMSPPEPTSLALLGRRERPARGEAGGVGVHATATSTRQVGALGDESFRLVPGVVLSVEVQADSALVVMVDGLAEHCDPSHGTAPSNAVLLLDGSAVSTRRLDVPFALGATEHFSWTWISAPLTEGAHQLQLAVQVEPIRPGADPDDVSVCVGHADPDLASRLTALELLARP